MVPQNIAIYSFRDTLLVSSTLSSQTELLFMRSPISGKIPKRLESAFPNKKGIPIGSTSGWPRMCLERNFLFYQIRQSDDATRRAWRGKEGDRQLNFLGQPLF